MLTREVDRVDRLLNTRRSEYVCEKRFNLRDYLWLNDLHKWLHMTIARGSGYRLDDLLTRYEKMP